MGGNYLDIYIHLALMFGLLVLGSFGTWEGMEWGVVIWKTLAYLGMNGWGDLLYGIENQVLYGQYTHFTHTLYTLLERSRGRECLKCLK